MHRLLLTILLIPFTFTIKADQKENAKSPCANQSFRQFDFWIGDWDVFDIKGTKVGTNQIEPILAGCALQENWQSVAKSKGQSYNIYDRTTQQWHQTWVDNSGSLLQLDGGLIDGKMVLQGKTESKNIELLNRISWSQEEGKVRQVWDISKDGGKSWQTIFNGLYIKQHK